MTDGCISKTGKATGPAAQPHMREAAAIATSFEFIRYELRKTDAAEDAR